MVHAGSDMSLRGGKHASFETSTDLKHVNYVNVAQRLFFRGNRAVNGSTFNISASEMDMYIYSRILRPKHAYH